MSENNKMVYGLKMNAYQKDEHTIEFYIEDPNSGKYRPTTVEHSSKREQKTKSNGEPYKRVHDNLFEILQEELIRQGKWDQN